jgi:hypothetical protein
MIGPWGEYYNIPSYIACAWLFMRIFLECRRLVMARGENNIIFDECLLVIGSWEEYYNIP